jgi:hypothetical protein
VTDSIDETQDFPRESWVFLVRRVDHDSYLISRGGEVSLVDATTLKYLIGKLLKGQTP